MDALSLLALFAMLILVLFVPAWRGRGESREQRSRIHTDRRGQQDS